MNMRPDGGISKFLLIPLRRPPQRAGELRGEQTSDQMIRSLMALTRAGELRGNLSAPTESKLLPTALSRGRRAAEVR